MKINVCLLILSCVCICFSCKNVGSPGQRHVEDEYIYLGEEIYGKPLYERDSMYAGNADPYGVLSTEGGIIGSPKAAADYAEVILSQFYRKETIDNDRPFRVKLVDGKVWMIEGSVNSDRNVYQEGGTFYISINKQDGRVLFIRCEK